MGGRIYSIAWRKAFLPIGWFWIIEWIAPGWFGRKGWIHPIVQNIPGQISWRSKEFNKFFPPNSSDDLCLFSVFVLLLWANISSQNRQKSSTKCILLIPVFFIEIGDEKVVHYLEGHIWPTVMPASRAIQFLISLFITVMKDFSVFFYLLANFKFFVYQWVILDNAFKD